MTKFEELKLAIEAACDAARAAESCMAAYRAARNATALRSAEEAGKVAAEKRNKAIAIAKAALEP